MTAPSPKVEQRLSQRLRQCADLSEAGLNFADTPQACREAAKALDLLTPSGDAEGRARITKADYPEIVQAIRWSDEDNGTNHFEPGVGFIVDDPGGVTVPVRWTPHLDEIEKALAGLDHQAPHPLDVDTIEWLAREGKAPTIDDSAARCFVCGEHTPMTAIANSSRELWIAHRFLNEYFEGWAFDPSVGFAAALTPPPAPTEAAGLREAFMRLLDATDRFNGCCSHNKQPMARLQGEMRLAVMNAYRVLGIGRTTPETRAALAKSPPAAVGEAFGYWVEQKHADPVLLRKPAYIPEPSELCTVTPLYTHPVAGALPDDVRGLVIAAREFWDENNDTASRTSNALDRALEPFSSRVPYADEPEKIA